MEFNQTLNLKPIYPHSHISLYNAPVIGATMPSLSLTSGLNIVTASPNGSLNINSVSSSNNDIISSNNINNSNPLLSTQAITLTSNVAQAHHQLVPMNSSNAGLNSVQIQQLQVYSKQPPFSRSQLQIQNNGGKQVAGGQIVQIQITNPNQLTSGATTSAPSNEVPFDASGFEAGQNVSNSSNSVPDTISNQSNGSLSSSLSPDMVVINNHNNSNNIKGNGPNSNNGGGSKNPNSRDLAGSSGSEYVDLAKASCSNGSAISMKLNSADNDFSIDSFKSISGRGFKCQICNRDFTQKGNLKTHLMTHSGERPYECQTCGKNFTQKGNLDTHVKIHTETKDHKCQYCDRGFTQRGNLKTHIRSIHTKEKPYACGHCGKAFSQKGNMLTHFRTHDKEARFPCNVCGKTFSQKGNLRTHQQRHGRHSER